MNKIITCFFFTIITFSTFSQNKKDQIEVLTKQTDSLNKLVETKNIEIKDFNLKIEQQSSIIQDKDKIISQLKNELTAINSQQQKTQKSLDSAIIANDSSSPFSSKKQILSFLVGEYSLDNISGLMGGNTLFDTYRNEQDNWASNYSVNEQGTREVYEDKLLQSDRDLLGNLRIYVDSNLNITLKSGSKIIFSSKFIEKGMDYKIVKPNDSELNEDISSLNPSSIFQDERLLIYARNGVELDSNLHGNFHIVTSDIIILSYNLFDAVFELYITANECCDNNSLIFKKGVH